MHDDELGIDGPHIFVGEALAVPRAALGRLEEDIGILQHLQQNFFAAGGELIQLNGAAVAALGLRGIFRIAHRIAIAGVLEPNNIGTPIAHDVARAGNSLLHGGEDDFDVIENAEMRFLGRNGSHFLLLH